MRKNARRPLRPNCSDQTSRTASRANAGLAFSTEPHGAQLIGDQSPSFGAYRVSPVRMLLDGRQSHRPLGFPPFASFGGPKPALPLPHPFQTTLKIPQKPTSSPTPPQNVPDSRHFQQFPGKFLLPVASPHSPLPRTARNQVARGRGSES